MIRVEGRRGDWITLTSGTKFFPLDPRDDEVLIEDITHALAHICRFGGHCFEFYSVAQHSVLVSKLAASMVEGPFALDVAKWGLLHDSAEAYIGDVIRPIKRCIPEFKEAENRLLKVIAKKFGLAFPIPDAVKQADEVILATEARDIMPPNCGSKWNLPGVADPNIHILPMPPDKAKDEFKTIYRCLFL